MKKITLYIFLFSTFLASSQSSHGLVHYGEIQSMGMGAPVGPDYNAILVFNNDQSLYITRMDSLEGGKLREQRSYETASGFNSITVVTNEIGFRYFNDKKNKTFYSRDLGFNLVKEPTPKIKWDITEENKKVGRYTVYKATGDFRGRIYTAWFTTEIPVPYGPWKLQGLPGLILEAYDTHKEIYWYFKALEYPTEHTDLLRPIKNEQKWLSFNDYRKKQVEAYKNSLISGRMGAESAEIPMVQNAKKNMLNTYIEGFDEEAVTE